MINYYTLAARFTRKLGNNPQAIVDAIISELGREPAAFVKVRIEDAAISVCENIFRK